MVTNILPFVLYVSFFWLLSQIDVFKINLSFDNRCKLIFLSFCLLALFAGGRWSSYEVGYDLDIFDYSTYKNVYYEGLNIFDFFDDYASADLEIKSQEPGYIFYSSFCRLILGDNFNLYLLFTNVLLVVLLWKSFRKNEIKYGYLFLLFVFVSRLYFQYNFILLRQAIAIFIVWAYGFPLLLNNKKSRFIVVVILASTFHFSALISLFALLFSRHLNTKYIVYAIIFFIALNVTGLMDRFFLSLIKNGLSILGVSAGIGEKLSKYLIEDDFRKMNVITFIEALPFAYITIKYKRALCSTSSGLFYYNMFYIFILLLAVTMNFGFLTRMCQYFMFSYFYLLAFYFHNKDNSLFKKMYFFFLSCYFLLYSYRYIYIWFYQTEYSFFLFKI